MTGRNRASFLLPACVLAATLAGPNLFAQTPQLSFVSYPDTPYSSSLNSPEPLGPVADAYFSMDHLSRQVRPFGDLAIAIKAGVAGIGFDLATPMSQRFNLRGGASFFSYNGNFDSDGTTIIGDLKLRSVNTSLDWYPFNNFFRISPGVTLYNGNGLSASATVPGGQSFDLGDNTYTSSPSDPIHGSAVFTFGNKVAPSITFGFGNMISRHGDGHWSVPVELGIQYISDPHITLALAGTACSNGFCQNTATNPQFQASLQQENVNLNNDIRPYRFFPIASIGVGYRF